MKGEKKNINRRRKEKGDERFVFLATYGAMRPREIDGLIVDDAVEGKNEGGRERGKGERERREKIPFPWRCPEPCV